MADKARSNDFSIFIRKIGYSVGLENTLERVMDFARVYEEGVSLTPSTMLRLLHDQAPNGWGLAERNEHILDVLRAIQVVDARKGTAIAMELGDSLAILRRLLKDDADFLVASRFLLLHQLILADGDVFLNGLAASYQGPEFAVHIRAMLEYKWTVLETFFLSEHHRRQIYSVVQMEVQESNPGSRGLRSGQDVDRLRLASARSSLSIAAMRPTADVSPNYLKKSLPRRRAWAQSLGIADSDGAPNELGRQLLAAVSRASPASQCCVALWPLEHEYSTPILADARSRGLPALSFFDSLIMAAKGCAHKFDLVDVSVDDGVVLLKEIGTAFRALDAARAVMRRELPARVAYRCAVALGLLKGRVPLLPGFVERQLNAPDPVLSVRRSKVAEFAISFEFSR